MRYSQKSTSVERFFGKCAHLPSHKSDCLVPPKVGLQPRKTLNICTINVKCLHYVHCMCYAQAFILCNMFIHFKEVMRKKPTAYIRLDTFERTMNIENRFCIVLNTLVQGYSSIRCTNAKDFKIYI